MLGPDDEYYENTLDEAEHRRKKYEMEDFSLTPYAEGTEALDTGSASDEQKLTLAWINERCAPALLMYQEELVSNLTEALELQDEKLEVEQSRDLNADVVASLCREEMERIKFVLRSYLRTRIQKIEQYVKYILSNRKEKAKLSAQESQYAERYLEVIERHYGSAVLEHLPDALRKLDDNVQGMSMVNSPDLNAAVFVKVTQNIGTITDGRTRVEDMKAGGIYIMRYATVQTLLEREQVTLL